VQFGIVILCMRCCRRRIRRFFRNAFESALRRLADLARVLVDTRLPAEAMR